MKIDHIKWRIKGFRQVRQSDRVIADLHARADRIAAACGPGYIAHSSVGKTRGRAIVLTATHQARRNNAVRNTLVRNLYWGR